MKTAVYFMKKCKKKTIFCYYFPTVNVLQFSGKMIATENREWFKFSNDFESGRQTTLHLSSDGESKRK